MVVENIEILLKKLAEKGGKIVSSASLTQLEVAEAQVEERMFVDETGLGFIWVKDD